MTTTTGSNYTWQDIIDDQYKWDDFEPFVYCTVSVNGGRAMPCEADRRGDWSMESELPSLKIKFTNKSDDYKGMDRLLMNKHPWDTTRFRNKLTFELLQRVPEMASQFTQFATLTVDGTFYGVYTLLEDIDDKMLRTHGMKKSSWLYKANKVRWDLNNEKTVVEVTDPKFSKDQFERFWDIRGDADDHSALLNAYHALWDPNVDSREMMAYIFNVENFATWLAFVYITANKDLVFNNFGVYFPKTSNNCQFPTPLYMMAWDNDGAWDDYYLEPDSDCVHVGPDGCYPIWNDGVQYFWNQRTVKRFLMVDEFAEILNTKMTYLYQNVFSPEAIQELVEIYKPILRPILELAPDVDHIAWSADIEEWLENCDIMANIPKIQYERFPTTMYRPMPFNQYMKPSDDGTSFFFYWDPSFIIGHKPIYYELIISTTNANMVYSQSTVVLNVTTANNYIAVAADKLASNTQYWFRVLAYNAEDPSLFSDSYQHLTDAEDDEVGWGVSAFTTGTLSPALAAPAPVEITQTRELTAANGAVYTYATLDNVDPATASSACPAEFRSIPEGWAIAPNAPETGDHIALIASAWGGSNLVLADGTRINSTGHYVDGFATYFFNFFSKAAADGAVTYAANCTASNHRILIFRATEPTTTIGTSSPALDTTSSSSFPDSTSSASTSDPSNPDSTTSASTSASTSDPADPATSSGSRIAASLFVLFLAVYALL